MTRRCCYQVLSAKDRDALPWPVTLACAAIWCSASRTGRPGTSDRNVPPPNISRLGLRALFWPAPSAPPSRAPHHLPPSQHQPWFVSGCYNACFAGVQQPIPGHQASARRCCREGKGAAHMALQGPCGGRRKGNHSPNTSNYPKFERRGACGFDWYHAAEPSSLNLLFDPQMIATN